jgi:antitoxin HigA-1
MAYLLRMARRDAWACRGRDRRLSLREDHLPRTPIHPGEHLAEELRELGLSAAELSRQIDVPVNRITGIIHGQRGITADTALRLGHWFGTSPQFWMNLQQNYELRLAESQVGAKIAVLPRRATRSMSRKLGKTA